ncbi:MAG: methylated-DNA--[protein]-cysteine S-methyltransferase [bacterium]|nr:methylated-DNA--[protein]-cysteine S-methyltransferase [bacterium]
MLKFTDTGRTVIDAPATAVGLAWTPRGIFRAELGTAAEVAANLAAHAPDAPPVKRPRGVIAAVVRRVKDHLRGRPDDLRDVPVDLAGQPEFGRKVLQALRRVSPGRTVTYGELAARAGRPGAARAVGRIMGANPVPLFVPCHRCMGADGRLTGFSSPGGVLLKARMLHLEGYVFDEEHERGRRHLMRCDPVMKRLIQLIGPYVPGPAVPRPAWDTLVRAIIHQQLSVKAGQTIGGRVAALTPGTRFPRPAEMLAIDDAVLRAAGLSWAKVSFVKDLAARVGDGRLRLQRLPHLDDEAVLTELMSVKGIGRWSAQMHLMFHLDRLDVLPLDDVGLQNAAGRAYGHEQGLTPAELAELGEAWRPYRSLGSWYLWQALDMGGI